METGCSAAYMDDVYDFYKPAGIFPQVSCSVNTWIAGTESSMLDKVTAVQLCLLATVQVSSILECVILQSLT